MKPDACSIALFDGTRVFLIERAFAPFRGLWTLPGGRIDPGESALDCIRREVFEETGFVVSDPYPVLTQTIGKADERFTLAVFAAFFAYHAPIASDEVSGWDWVEIDGLGALKTTPGLAEVVRTCAERLEIESTHV